MKCLALVAVVVVVVVAVVVAFAFAFAVIAAVPVAVTTTTLLVDRPALSSTLGLSGHLHFSTLTFVRIEHPHPMIRGLKSSQTPFPYSAEEKKKNKNNDTRKREELGRKRPARL